MQTPRSQRVNAIEVDPYRESRIVMLTKINLYLDWAQAQLPSAVNANRFRCGNVELNRPRCGGLRHRFSSSLAALLEPTVGRGIGQDCEMPGTHGTGGG